MLSHRTRTERGDTIVEVLICIAVVGAVLAGAFVVTNRSQLGVRDSQEHAEAAKLVESQLEQLRSSAKRGNAVFGTATPSVFCMRNAAVVNNVAGNVPQCNVDSGGVNAGRYRMEITRAGAGSGADGRGSVFEIKVSWDSISGGNAGRAMESMLYRLYP